MACEVIVDEAAGIVRAHYRGEVSMQERLSTAFRMLVEADLGGFDRFLCDYRSAQASNVGDLDAPEVIDQYISRLPAGARLAYVLKFDHQLDDTLETLMREQGMLVERFTDPERAVSWLRSPAAETARVHPPARVPEHGTLDGRRDLKRTMRLVAEVVGPEPRVSPDQFAAMGELVHDLLARGVDEATVRDVARQMVAAMRH